MRAAKRHAKEGTYYCGRYRVPCPPVTHFCTGNDCFPCLPECGNPNDRQQPHCRPFCSGDTNHPNVTEVQGSNRTNILSHKDTGNFGNNQQLLIAVGVPGGLILLILLIVFILCYRSKTKSEKLDEEEISMTERCIRQPSNNGIGEDILVTNQTACLPFYTANMENQDTQHQNTTV